MIPQGRGYASFDWVPVSSEMYRQRAERGVDLSAGFEVGVDEDDGTKSWCWIVCLMGENRQDKSVTKSK